MTSCRNSPSGDKFTTKTRFYRLKGGTMKKATVIAAAIILFTGCLQPALAQNTGFWGGGIYNLSFWTLPTVRFGLEEDIYFDFGLTFSTESSNNFAVLFKGAGRFHELSNAVDIHGGALISIAEVADETAFQFGLLLGAEGFVNDSFSVTGDIAPLLISANGDTEAHFLRGYVGINVYIR